MNESSHTLIQKSFTFQDSEDSLTVSIPEVQQSLQTYDFNVNNLSINSDLFQVLDSQYGMYVWPCAVVLSQYVWMAREELQNKTVLEVLYTHLMP